METENNSHSLETKIFTTDLNDRILQHYKSSEDLLSRAFPQEVMKGISLIIKPKPTSIETQLLQHYISHPDRNEKFKAIIQMIRDIKNTKGLSKIQKNNKIHLQKINAKTLIKEIKKTDDYQFWSTYYRDIIIFKDLGLIKEEKDLNTSSLKDSIKALNVSLENVSAQNTDLINKVTGLHAYEQWKKSINIGIDRVVANPTTLKYQIRFNARLSQSNTNRKDFVKASFYSLCKLYPQNAQPTLRKAFKIAIDVKTYANDHISFDCYHCFELSSDLEYNTPLANNNSLWEIIKLSNQAYNSKGIKSYISEWDVYFKTRAFNRANKELTLRAHYWHKNRLYSAIALIGYGLNRLIKGCCNQVSSIRRYIGSFFTLSTSKKVPVSTLKATAAPAAPAVVKKPCNQKTWLSVFGFGS